jgi:diguanylate cyclase (GGDEF)-like protein
MSATSDRKGTLLCSESVGGDRSGAAERPEMLKWFTTILVAVTCLFLVVFIYPLRNWQGAAVLTILTLAGLLTPALYRWSGSLPTATHYFAAICFTTVVSIATFTGGLYAPAIAWLVTVPLVGTMLSGPRVGGIWLAIVAAEVILISLIAPEEFARAQTLSADEYQFLTGLSLLGLAGCVFAALLVGHLTISAAERRLHHFATRDGLTGLFNHRVMMEVLERETAAARDGISSVALIMIDVDYFKSVNDRYGHVAGDQALQETARRITGCLRPDDYVGRYGGEEFLCILPDCPLPTARHLAELTRQAIAGRDVIVGERSIPMSVSVGVAVCNCDEDPNGSDALRRADRALYTAKRCGRNRTCIDASSSSRSPAYKCELPIPGRTMTLADVQECVSRG